MVFQPVLMIWNYYDGPRSGLAMFDDEPHCFNCLWDKSANNYSNLFELSPVDGNFLAKAKKQLLIFKEWEHQFHSGLVESNTHPGHGGINKEYDILEKTLKIYLTEFVKLSQVFNSEFKVLPNQYNSPLGALRKLEFNWTKAE